MNLYQATIFYLLLLVCVVAGFAVREPGEDEERGPEISITYGRSSSSSKYLNNVAQSTDFFIHQ